MSIVDGINESWGWCGIDAAKVVAENEFGNLLIRDRAERYWRLCPEELSCAVVAEHRAALDALCVDPEFVQDWNMDVLVELAQTQLGALQHGRKYCLKIPAVLGGEYIASNLATIAFPELIGVSGSLAEQISDLPDGANVRLSIKN